MFLTLVYLKNKKPKKKKKKTNFIYKVKLKPRIMERLMGEQGKRLGQSQYHILNMGRCWFLLASLGWLEHSALWQTQPNTKSSLARTPFLRQPRGDPSPKNLLLHLAGPVPSRGRAQPRPDSMAVSSVYWHQTLMTYLKSLSLPCLILNWKRTGESTRLKGPRRNPKVEGKMTFEGCRRCWI